MGYVTQHVLDVHANREDLNQYVNPCSLARAHVSCLQCKGIDQNARVRIRLDSSPVGYSKSIFLCIALNCVASELRVVAELERTYLPRVLKLIKASLHGLF